MKKLILVLIVLALQTSIIAQDFKYSKQKAILLENKGQLSNTDGSSADNVLYYMITPNMNFYITNSGVTYVFKGHFFKEDSSSVNSINLLKDKEQITKWHRVDVDLVDAKIEKSSINQKNLNTEHVVNYYNHLMPDGVGDLIPLENVTLKDVYPGIDWEFVVNDEHLEYNFILNKKADISKIKLHYKGQDKISLENNSVKIETKYGSLIEKEIVSFTSKGRNATINAVLKDNELSYNPVSVPKILDDETLIIDPPLIWSTFYGGSGSENNVKMTMIKNSGDIFVALTTSSSNFPLLYPGGSSYYDNTYHGNNDIALFNFNKNGALKWSTYYGGSSGDSAFNLCNNGLIVFVVGRTRSADFPTMAPPSGGYLDPTLGGYKDGFIIAFNALTRQRYWATYFGGSFPDIVEGYTEENTTACACKGINLYITGTASSNDFPIVTFPGADTKTTMNDGAYPNPASGRYFTDAYLSLFTIAGAMGTEIQLVWSTFVGGKNRDIDPEILLDNANNITLAYTTTDGGDITQINTLSPPGFVGTYNNGIDIAFTRFDSNKKLVWQTYIGSTGAQTYAQAMVNNSSNEFFVAGSARGTITTRNDIGASYYYNTKKGSVSDAFLLKFNSNCQLVYGSYWGGKTNQNYSRGLCLDKNNNLLLVGQTLGATGNDGLIYKPYPGSYVDSTYNGSNDGVILKLSPTLSPIWGTYFGGSGGEVIYDIEANNDDEIFILGRKEDANATGFPIVNLPGAYNDSPPSSSDAFLAKFIPCPTNFGSISSGTDSVCYGQKGTISADGGNAYLWSTGETTSSITPTIVSDSTFIVTSINTLGCEDKDTFNIKVKPLPVLSFTGTTTVCLEDTVKLTVSGGTSYLWETGQTTPNISFVPTISDYISVTATNNFGCSKKDSVAYTVHPLPTPSISGASEICSKDTLTLTASGGDTYLWSNGVITAINNIVLDTSGNINYYVIATNTHNCKDTAFHTFTVNPLPVIDLGNDTSICDGTSIILDAENPGSTYAWNTTETTQTISINTTGEYSVTVTDVNSCKSKDTMNLVVLPNADATITDVPAICIDGTPFTYIVAEAGGTWTGTGISPTGNFDPSIGTGNYEFIYTIAGQCGDADTTNITVNPLPIVDLGNDTTICDGTSIILDAENPGSTYAWNTTETTQTISINTAGEYSVTVTDVNSCTNKDTITIAVLPNADATITDVPFICIDGTPFSYIVAEAGGTWSGTGISLTGDFDPSIGVGDYEFIYTIAGECGDVDTTNITVNPLPVINLGNDTSICDGTSIILDAENPGSTYAWNTTETTQTISINTAGEYSVTVTDVNSCTNKDTITIAVLPSADATITTDVPFICMDGAPFTYIVAETGGTWAGTGISTTGDFDPSIGAGTYNFTYTIAGKCGDTDATSITVGELPIINFIATNETCEDKSDGSLLLNITGGTLPYQYFLDSIPISESTNNLMPGNYLLTVIDNNNCSQSDSVFILAGDFPCDENVRFFIPNIFSPNNDNNNDVLYVKSEFIKNLEFMIYDRFGNVVFESKDINIGWDGKYKGEPAEEGVYFWEIKAIMIDNTELNKIGNTTLVR